MTFFTVFKMYRHRANTVSGKLVHLSSKEGFLLMAKLMHLVVKLRFGFLFKYFPQHKALCSYFAVIPEIPKTKF